MKKYIKGYVILSICWLFPFNIVAQSTSNDDRSNGGSPLSSAAIIPIHGAIDRAQVIFIRRSIEQYKDASTIIFDIDTFGGRVDSALSITTLIGSLSDIQTVAYTTISPERSGVSWSAGALIAMACDAIYMAPGTSIGAAAPVIASSDGSSELADEKTVSALRAQMAALAEKNGHPRDIALAMVDADIELFEVIVDDELVVSSANRYSAIERQANEDGATITKGEVISPAGKLLTLTAGDMERYGVSAGSPRDFDEISALLGLGEVERVERSNSDAILAFATSGVVTTLLILCGLVALFLEITSPGFGLPGTVALISFTIVFGSNLLIGYVESIEILLFLAGATLLLIELFILPGFGIAGIGGIICVIIALTLARQDFILPSRDWEWGQFNTNLLITLGCLVGGLLLVIGFSPVARHPRILRRIALTHTFDSAKGYTAKSVDDRLLGAIGETRAMLRPSGKVIIGEQIVDAQSEGDYIERGRAVSVVAIKGSYVVVRTINEEEKKIS